MTIELPGRLEQGFVTTAASGTRKIPGRLEQGCVRINFQQKSVDDTRNMIPIWP